MAFERRLCTFTGRPISHTDSASVQLSFVELDSEGQSTGEIIMFDVSGSVRRDGTIDKLVYHKMAEMN
jgi:hypothetical protein